MQDASSLLAGSTIFQERSLDLFSPTCYNILMSTNENKTDLTVANTILQQLGGRQFLMMVGAKTVLGEPLGLIIRLGRNAKKATHFQVSLNSDDTYDAYIRKVNSKTFEVKDLAVAEGIYCDQLREFFERETGLLTRLF